MPSRLRHLILVLGDQLNADSAAFDGFDRTRDCVWMAEAGEESAHVWSHKARIALFLSGMRHFRAALETDRIPLHYTALDDDGNTGTLAGELQRVACTLAPARLIVVEPGEWRVRQALGAAARDLGLDLEIRPDRHFLCSREQFAAHASGRTQLRMEYFYREMRRSTGILMEDGTPCGGRWNYDAENRDGFGKAGPGAIAPPRPFHPDATTHAALALVQERFANHPGALARFDWPVTSAQASDALAEFVANRLPFFGRYQDAMWTDEPYLYHSRLAAALNLKLLDPRAVIAAAARAHARGHAPLAAVEGFIRQILGWREYVRGVYWRFMPEYLARNALDARAPLPAFYWTADTDMRCLRTVIAQTLEYGYAHHIQRLMVTGLFALLLGVDPVELHKWYLAVYVDAVEWVELPNTLGMSQFADGGTMASKPYVATGKYIQRMSNYCRGCRFDPAERTGDTACPFTTLYWDFLSRHRTALAGNQRMRLQLRNIDRLGPSERREIASRAAQVRARLC